MTPTISEVNNNYPCEIAGMSAGDVILEINDNKTSTIDDVQIYLTLAKPGTEVEFKVQKADGTIKEYDVTPVKEKIDGVESYKFGISFGGETERGFVKSIKYSFIKFGALIKQMAIVIKSLFTGALSLNSLSGPVGIFSIVGQTSESGIEAIIQLIALLSVNVGFINLIPFPAFDGGRILFLIIEKIKGSPVSAKVENIIHSIGFILLMLLILYVTFNDIIRLF